MNKELQDIANQIRHMTETELLEHIADDKVWADRYLRFLTACGMTLDDIGTDCAFCGEPATDTTSADDRVCRSCWQEFEDYLNSGDTE